jgi:serine/threonine-protein kinase
MSQAEAEFDDLTRAEAHPTSPVQDSFVPRRRIIEGRSRQALADETQELLRRRLTAASLVLGISFAVFLVRDYFFPRYLQSLAIFHALILLALVLNLAALWSRWTPSMRQLRSMELMTFGLVVVFFVLGQYLGLLARVRNGELTPSDLSYLSRSGLIWTLLLIFTYGIFIPNGWRRAAMVILPMALSPLAAPLILRATSPGFRTVVQEAWVPEKLTENLLFLILGALTAIFGTHTMTAIRTEAFRARRMNQYRLTRKLGSGGMGEVYLAEHQFLKRACAIKLIRPKLSDNPRALARFELEVRATARLSHWNTVEVYDYGRTEAGTFYYVMEYLPGLSVQELVERHGPLPPGRAIYLLRQACDALREAHRAGLVHRDLKPPNLFAAYRGGRFDVTKLLDFGLVKPTRDEEAPGLTRDGMVTGSPLYMAPEQVMSTHTPDARTDLYALGAVAYFMLTGRPPFEGPDAMAVMVAHARDPVAPPSTHIRSVPGDLEEVVLRCLAKEPKDRFQDAEGLAQALAACTDAGSWSVGQAEEWWHAHEPSITEMDDDLPGDLEDVSLVSGGDGLATLGASEIPLGSSDSVDRTVTIEEVEPGEDPRS